VPARSARIPKFDLADEDVVSRELVVEQGRVAVLLRYVHGLEITLHVDGDQVWFEANREWTRDAETGVVSFERA
jgi:hypothetical protein